MAADKARFGDDGLMEKLLPTLNQVLAHCGLRWENALTLGGMEPTQRPPRRRGSQSGLRNAGAAGMTAAEVSAVYAALNERWPSSPVLLAFARAVTSACKPCPLGA